MNKFDSLLLEFPVMEAKAQQSARGGYGGYGGDGGGDNSDWWNGDPNFTFNLPEVVITPDGGGSDPGNSDPDGGYYVGYYGGNYGGDGNNDGGGGGGGSSSPGATGPTINGVRGAVEDPNAAAWKDAGTMILGGAEALVGLLSEEFSAGTSTFLVVDGADRAMAAFHNLLLDVDSKATDTKWSTNLGGQIGGAVGGAQGELVGSIVNDGITGVITGGPIADAAEAFEALEEQHFMKAVISGYSATDGTITIHEYIHKVNGE